MTCNIKKRKTDFYLLEQGELFDFKVEQTVLLKEKFLNDVCRAYVREKHNDLFSLDEWYPFVNSYYPYTEDVDAVARVNHLLDTKPSFASLSSIECGSEIPENPLYSEASAQFQYLESNPVSFIILGKPGIGEQELGKLLADYWQCVYIDPEVLIQQEINSDSRAGECIEFNLRCGRAIGIDVVLRLVEKRIKSESAKHKGFVICGLPLIPNDLYEEDPISSESAVFNVKEIFEEVFDTVIELGVPPSKPHVSISSKYKSGVEEEAEEEEEGKELGEEEEAEEVPLPTEGLVKTEEPEMPVDLGPDFDVCGYPEISNNYEDQLNFIFDLMKPPFLLIYIMCSSTDVINKRDNYRFDVYSKQTINLQAEKCNKLFFNYFSTHQDFNNEDRPEEFLEVNYIDVDSSQLTHLVRLPRNFPANVSSQLDTYHYTALNFIERRVLMHDPEYFLKVDGRTNVYRMFHIIKARLKVLPLHRVLLPVKLNTVEETLDIGEGEPVVFDIKGMTLEECYRDFCKRQIPSGLFKWKWSDWGTKCPVSMKDGMVKDGDPNFAVRFMNRMFFLANEEAFFKFHCNPRPYLLPPNPKPVCKIFIFGPRCSGKTALAKCFSYLFKGEILSINDILDSFLSLREGEYKEKVRQAAIAEAMQILDEKRIAEAERMDRERVENVKQWMNMIADLIKELITLLEREGEPAAPTLEISSFPMAMQKKDQPMEIENEITIGIWKIRNELETYEIPYSDHITHWKNLSKDKKKLLNYMPDDLRKKILPKPATVFDDFVIEYAENAVARAVFDSSNMETENMVNVFTNALKAAEDQGRDQGTRTGWIVDGMLCDLDFIKQLNPQYQANEILILRDDDKFEFLTNRFKTRNENRFWDFRQFFMELGKIDAAWRCPSVVSTKSFKNTLVQDILSEIFGDDSLFGNRDEDDTNIDNRTKAYREDLIRFYEKWEPINAFFLENDVKPIEITVTDKSVSDLMKEVIAILEDKYRLTASVFTEEDRAEEVKNIGNQMTQKDVGEDVDVPQEEDTFEKNRRYGDSHYYCPVTFHETGVLWKGKEDLAVKFDEKLYLLCSEADMDKFLLNPRKYVTGKPAKIFPPPRICVIGVPGIGKTFLSKVIADNFGLSYISYESLLKTFFNITSKETLDELRHKMEDNEEDLADEEFDSTELNIYKYLNDDEPLPEVFFETLLRKVWFEQPCLGLVLDDFPKRPSDVDFMTKYKLIPDVVIYLTINENQILNTLLERCLDRWETEVNEMRRQQVELNKNNIAEWEENRRKRYEELIEQRREQRYSQKRKEQTESSLIQRPYLEDIKESDEETDRSGFRTSSQVSFDSVAEQEDIDEVNRILEIELPEIVIDDPLERIEAEKEKFEYLISNAISVETGFILDIKALCTTELILFKEVTSNFDYPDMTIRNAFVIIDNFKYRTKSHLERCYDISMEVADRLLSCGYFFLSKFGRTCPVQYLENKNPIQMFSIMEQKYNVFPVIHRSYIYYIIGKENQSKFKEEPLKYIEVENFHFPMLSFRMAVIGPPKSGKTILADRIKNEFGFKLVTRGQAARYVLRYLPFSDLATNMECVLRKGWELTDEMVAKCVEAASLDSRAVTHARRVPVPDDRFDYLCEYFKPISKVPAFLNVVDIAGLVKGASEGQGLGNAFLSHISACDAIFHLCRAFEDDDVTHVEGEVNPVRDLDIIGEELRLKDEDTLTKNLEKLERTVGRGADKKLKPEYDTLLKVKQVLVDEKKHIRFADWDGKDIEVLNKYLFLTSKPALYLINLAEKDYIKKKNKWLIKIKEWVDKNDPGALIIPFSGVFEYKLIEEYGDPALKKKFLEDNSTTSALDKIIVQGYKALQLEYFFTAGPDEVKAWTIQKGTKAPQAAGRIHTDFEKGFIMAEVMKYVDFKEEGSEAACKAAGKYRQQGRNYVVEDGDIIFFKFNAGAGLQQAKKK